MCTKSTAIQIICTIFEPNTLTYKCVLSYFPYSQTNLSTSSSIRSNMSTFLKWMHVNTKFRLEWFICLKILRLVLSEFIPIYQNEKSICHEVWQSKYKYSSYLKLKKGLLPDHYESKFFDLKVKILMKIWLLTSTQNLSV